MGETKRATQTLSGARPGEYLPALYRLPAALTRGQSRGTVRFQAKDGGTKDGGTAGGLFDLRVVRP